MTWKSMRRSIRGRIWTFYMGAPERGRWRYYLAPWLGGDEYNRRTLVLPVLAWGVVIALWEHPHDDECAEWHDPIWVRWKSIRRFGRIER
ncbi:hypothetical protein IU449_27100 [Nocardia higoensis]|uniref:Uncharacterized protein n=1 Tax=Nocardia higoensis TaxID=228599 RepID=A0ABS0DMA5_9NOCA|nr:hypothetical protein [Nocardia higoensis]MBF6358169.1 hypothetical protein [Nocardia higoensis]